MSELKRFFENSKTIEEYSASYFKYLSSILQKTDRGSIAKVANIFLNAKQNNKKIFFAGNGGSASTASHFAADFAKNVSNNPKGNFRAISLVDNTALTTAVSNDEGYDNIFARQLAVLMEKGDVVVGISASGNSENVLKAIRHANSNGGISIGLVGFDGGKLKKEAKHCIHFPSLKGEYGPVEDAHIIIDHIITSYLYFSGKKKK